MQLKEKKSTMERDKRKLETELERQRQTIGKQVFLQVVQKKQQNQSESPTSLTSSNQITTTTLINNNNNTTTNNNSNNNTQTSNNQNLLPEIVNPKSPRETTRRQWDKTNKNNSLIDLEQNESGYNYY